MNRSWPTNDSTTSYPGVTEETIIAIQQEEREACAQHIEMILEMYSKSFPVSEDFKKFLCGSLQFRTHDSPWGPDPYRDKRARVKPKELSIKDVILEKMDLVMTIVELREEIRICREINLDLAERCYRQSETLTELAKRKTQ